MIQVEDDYLGEDLLNYLVGEFTKDSTPYYLGLGVNHVGDGYLQFVHTIYGFIDGVGEIGYQGVFDSLQPIFQKLNVGQLLFCKVNFLQRSTELVEHGWHIDVNDIAEDSKDRCKTAVLYLNSNNGYTLFKNGVKVPSKENRMVIFPNDLEHSGTTNTCDALFRINLILNYFTK